MKKQIISPVVRKIKIFLSTVIAAGMLFATASCVDNTESESVSALRNAKAEELNASAELLRAQAVAENIRANAEKVLKEAEAKLKEGEAAVLQAEVEIKLAQAKINLAMADYQKAQADYQQAIADKEAYELSIMEGTKAEEIAAKKAEYDAKIALYEAQIVLQESNIALYQAQIAEQERLKQKSLNQTAQLLVDLEVQRIRNQTELAQAANDAQIAVLNQTYQLAMAKINADLNKQTVISNLIYQYNQLLLEINGLDNTIASNELHLAEAQAYLAVAYFDKSIDSADYVRNFEKDTADWNAKIEGYRAQIEAKTQAIDFWNSFKVEDLEKTIAAELDTLNNVLRPKLAAASEASAESYNYLYNDEPGDDDIWGTEDDILSPTTALSRIKDTLRYLYLYNNFSTSWDGEKYTYSYSPAWYTSYSAIYSYPLHTDSYSFNFSSTADTKTKLVEAQTIALVIAKDIEYLKLDSTRDAKLLADTFVYYSNLGTKYIAAKTALDNVAKSWTDSYNGYTASPQTVTEALFKIADSTYCDKYVALYGGTASGYQTRPNGISYMGFDYNGKSYGVYGWMSLNEEYYDLDYYVRSLKSNIDTYYIPRITSRTLSLASVNNLIGLLNSDKLATYQAAYDAAKDDYAAKQKEYDDVYAQTDKKRILIGQLGSIALGYGKVINFATYLVEEIPGYNVPDGILTITIGLVKSFIENLESEIVYLEGNIEGLENSILGAERELERVALLGKFHYSLGYNTAWINTLKSDIEYYTRNLVIYKGQKEIKESDAAALKVTIENAFE